MNPNITTMSDWVEKTRSLLTERGYRIKSVEEAERGYQNEVVRANCESAELAVKWFVERDKARNTADAPSNSFIGGWYIQTRINKFLDVPLPNIRFAEFSDDYFYVMDNIDFQYADDLWSNDMYLMRLCQEMGSVLSEIHSINESRLGGIPGKKNSTMENMRIYIQQVESTISGTPYMAYNDKLSSLDKRYEQIFNPRSTKCLVHGDPNAGNILTDENGVIVGLVDWEDAMYADPLLDLAIFQAMVCDIFGVFSPWEIETLRESVVESYSRAVNTERLNILRAFVHLWAGAKINSDAMLSPWNRVAGRSQMTRQEIHRNRFENLVNEII
jgi:aminoglycoside phosphotransferase (APT) family kinase protein